MEDNEEFSRSFELMLRSPRAQVSDYSNDIVSYTGSAEAIPRWMDVNPGVW